MKSAIAAIAGGAALFGATAAPVSAHTKLRCSELKALAEGALWQHLPGAATGCRRIGPSRYYVQGRRWKASLTVVHRACPPDPAACHAATDVVYNPRP